MVRTSRDNIYRVLRGSGVHVSPPKCCNLRDQLGQRTEKQPQGERRKKQQGGRTDRDQAGGHGQELPICQWGK